MKSIFPGFYSPSTEEYDALWNEGLVVLDTNVLLTFYRLPANARDLLFQALNTAKERLWVPHQVALEFQLRRTTVIANERKSIESLLQNTQSLVAQLSAKLEDVRLDERGLNIETLPLIEDLEKSKNKIINAIKTVHDSQIDVFSNDDVRERIDALLDGKIGNAPKNQSDLDKLTESGEERYKSKIPPGFNDASKDKNENESSFRNDGILYQRKFGDLILWRQIIEHAKTNNINKIIFITDDKKTDWWKRDQGKNVGVHPELVNEIRKEASVDLFWMYSSEQFVQIAMEKQGVEVPKDAMKEIIEATQLSPAEDISSIAIEGKRLPTNQSQSKLDEKELDFKFRILRRWINFTKGPAKGYLNESPNLKYSKDGKLYGFEVFFLEDLHLLFNSIHFAELINNSLKMKEEGLINNLTLALIIPEYEFNRLREKNKLELISSISDKLAIYFGFDGIIIGSVIDENVYALVDRQWRSDGIFDVPFGRGVNPFTPYDGSEDSAL